MALQRFLHFIVLLSFTLSIFAKEISPLTAESIGKDFIAKKKSSLPTRSGGGTDVLSLSYTAQKNGKICYYVYNCNSGGFVIVSADDRTVSPVLGYSTEGNFDYSTLGDNVKGWMDSYTDMVNALDTLPSIQRKETRSGNLKSVAPLLGDIAWNQGEPYNLMCPTVFGVHTLTGCVPTALGMIAYYHRWPERGRGLVYNAEDDYKSVIDLSESVYKWDLMKPKLYASDPDDSKMAVSLLLRDLGYAFMSTYSLEATSAHVTTGIEKMVEIFGYSQAALYHNRNYYYDAEWDQLIKDEIDSMRPVLYAGPSHAFVCDGYDEDGYFHFNFGWGGVSNGYFLTSVIEVKGYDFSTGQSMVTHIFPDGGEKPGLLFRALDDMFLSKDGLDNPVISSHNCSWSLIALDNIEDYYCGICMENKTTGETKFLPDSKIYHKYSTHTIFWSRHIDSPDGEYRIFLAIGNADGSNFVKAEYPGGEESYIDLTIRDGQESFECHRRLTPGAGRIYKDGFFYKLDKINHTAAVSDQGTGNHPYYEDIVIPESILEDGEKYVVTAIADSAFMSCPIRSVCIPNTIQTIGNYAFAKSDLKSVEFRPGSNLKSIGKFSFSVRYLDHIVLPDCLEVISDYAFYNCEYLISIDIPASVEKIGQKAIYPGKNNLKDITVHWTVPRNMIGAFEWGNGKATLHVPEGTSALYSAISCWSRFEIEEGYWSEKIQIGDFWYKFKDSDKTASLVTPKEGKYKISDKIIVPETVEYNGSIYRVIEIGEKAFESNYDLNEVFVPKTVIKIMSEAFHSSNLAKIEFEEGSELTEIRYRAFSGTLISSIKLPEKLKVIEDESLMCTRLIRIELPVSIESIGWSALPTNYSDLEYIVLNWEKPVEVPVKGPLRLDENKNLKVYVPEDTRSVYEKSPTWSVFSIVEGQPEEKKIVVNEGLRFELQASDMTAGVISAGDNGEKYEGDIVIPSIIYDSGEKFTVTSIRHYAFKSCNIATVSIPASIEKIHTQAFMSSQVSEFNIEKGSRLLEIGRDAFKECHKLQNLHLYEGLETIGTNCFEGSSLKEIWLPASLAHYYFSLIGAYYNQLIVHVAWSEPVVWGENVFGGKDSMEDMTLYVPEGTKEKYATVVPWCYFGNIIEEAVPANTMEINNSDVNLRMIAGGLEIEGDYSSLKIYDTGGRMIKNLVGENRVLLPMGFYIVVIDGKASKIAIR